MSIFYLLTHDDQDSNLYRPEMSQSIIPYLLGTLVFLIYVWYSSVRGGSGLHRRVVEQFEFSEATLEEKVIYLMNQMRWWDYYYGLSVACQTGDWPSDTSVTYIAVCVAYFYILSMTLAMAEIQFPSLWAVITDGRRME
ncbi:hypothetical protein FLAG1_06283 [Fusarium langsethiae]|uniref:Uncharacterized protein n=1 Tax=Fusarium langsethiae TaxID=179993 RepID=A0A0N0V6S0_FUSLA|nr:hypothetical protein FLAG1_06283 [Fusarium langsethiae]GKU04039.1 unnamed protein product [Fusarium langsethiae]GKU20619.1 unnamed protein product [Fusarium langsethiae]